jgi:cytochrome c556
MKTMAKAIKSVDPMALGKESLDGVGISTAATTISEHGSQILTLFPKGSGGGVSGAGPNIWRDPDGFRASARATVSAAGRFGASARTDNPGVVKQVFRALGKTCSACHKDYRVKMNKR